MRQKEARYESQLADLQEERDQLQVQWRYGLVSRKGCRGILQEIR